MEIFLGGATAMGYAMAGLFFLKFWRKTHDRLFALFAIAFWVLALNRLALHMINQATEGNIVCYVIRLLAFLLILSAIIDKNRASARDTVAIKEHVETGAQ